MNCGLLFSSPRLTAESNERFYRSDVYRALYEDGDLFECFNAAYDMAAGYSYKPFEETYYRKFMFLDFLNDSRIDYQSICEVGAGGGTNLVPFEKMGKHCTGYEYSERLTQLGQSKALNLIQGTIDDIDDTYDLVILIHVLEHFLDPIRQLNRLFRHVKRYLLIEVPGIVSKVPSIQNAHNYYFSVNTLLRCMAISGFKLLDCRVIHENDFIIALFEPFENHLYEYNFEDEIKKRLGLIRRFKLISLTRRVIQGLPFGSKIYAVLRNRLIGDQV